MTDTGTLLARIPDHVKPLAAMIIGGLMLIAIVLFHGAGIHLILVRRKRLERDLLRGRPHIVAVLLLFGWSVFLMLALHVAEFAIWALALIRMGLIIHTYDAIYFCANAYTTLGYGNVDLDPLWRNLSPIIGISGLFTMAWTTGVLASVVSSHSRLLEQIEEEREQEAHMRSNLRKEEWDILQKERAAEKLERDKIRTQLAGESFFQRYSTWNVERNAVSELRRRSAQNAAALLRAERQAEENLQRNNQPNDPPDESAKP